MRGLEDDLYITELQLVIMVAVMLIARDVSCAVTIISCYELVGSTLITM